MRLRARAQTVNGTGWNDDDIMLLMSNFHASCMSLFSPIHFKQKLRMYFILEINEKSKMVVTEDSFRPPAGFKASNTVFSSNSIPFIYLREQNPP